jgi:integrase
VVNPVPKILKILTDAAVRKYAPTGAKRAIRDGGARSLYLIVATSGAKSWQMRFRRPGGKIGKLIIGSVDLSGKEIEGEPTVGMPLSLSAARQLAAMIHRDRAHGRDVIADHKRRRVGSVGNFQSAVRQYVEDYARPKVREWRELARMLGLDPDSLEPFAGGLAERWADKEVSKIDGHDVHSVVDEARRVAVPGIAARRDGASDSRARKLFTTLSGFFGWALRQRLVTANVCTTVHKPSAPKARDRFLSDSEIVKFWPATESVSAPFRSALRILLLTGQRLNEIAALRWDEVADDGASINLPGSRTKNHRAHTIPLSAAARKIIMGVDRIENCPYVFSANGRNPVSAWSKAKAALDREMKIPPWRLHDLRRTAVTGMAELGIAVDVVELVVNHISGTRGGVAGTYNRSEKMTDRRAALERWAGHLAGLIEGKPSNVASIAGKRR